MYLLQTTVIPTEPSKSISYSLFKRGVFKRTLSQGDKDAIRDGNSVVFKMFAKLEKYAVTLLSGGIHSCFDGVSSDRIREDDDRAGLDVLRALPRHDRSVLYSVALIRPSPVL